MKQVNDDPTYYATRPLENIVVSLDQEIRIKFTYPGGFIDYAEFLPMSFRFKKDGPGTYIIEAD
ncbi:hypothetical protein VT85_00025 [Planctomyces sp. SH-PL62]|nr:hypothetical protein VT85_00025 [Planctomyces sp. SH-PL62]